MYGDCTPSADKILEHLLRAAEHLVNGTGYHHLVSEIDLIHARKTAAVFEELRRLVKAPTIDSADRVQDILTAVVRDPAFDSFIFASRGDRLDYIGMLIGAVPHRIIPYHNIIKDFYTTTKPGGDSDG